MVTDVPIQQAIKSDKHDLDLRMDMFNLNIYLIDLLIVIDQLSPMHEDH